MSAARWGTKWADVDEDDDSDASGEIAGKTDAGARFETQADENGIKMVIEYKEREGKTYKVTKRVKQTVVTKWTNKAMTERKSMPKFGKVVTNDPKEEAMHVQQSQEDVNVEFSRKTVTLAAKDDVEEKFFDESINVCESLFKERKVWTDVNRDKQTDRDADPTGIRALMDEKKIEPIASASGPTPAEGSRYVPPSMRGKDGGGKGDGKGGKDFQQQQEASLRITNLSEDAKEGDLQELFGQFGRLQRVYIAKDRETGYPRGFAFITYYNRVDAQKAIDKLHGHGYDNLIMQVSFAKPKE